MLLTWTMIGVGIISLEMINYLYYRRTVNYIEDKKDHSTETMNHINSEFMENFWINELSKKELIDWILNTTSYYSVENDDFSGYYKPVPLIDISREKMFKWIGYHMYFKSIKKMNDEEIMSVDRVLTKIESKIKHNFYRGKINQNELSEKIYFLKFGYGKVETTYKPLIVYSSLNFVKNVTYTYLNYLGFQKCWSNSGRIAYFLYDAGKNKPTTIFIHGLGFGVTPYISFIKKLMQTTSLIVPILPNISNMEFIGLFETMDTNKLFPGYPIWRDDFKKILIKHNINKVNIIAHSFGTIIMSVLLKDKWINNVTKKKVFIDPVCFLDQSYKIFRYINEPDCRDGSLINRSFNALIYRDVYVRYATQRFLYGPEYWFLDYENLKPDDTLIILADKDQIVPSNGVYKRFSKYGIPHIVINDAEHADIFSSDKYEDVIQKIKAHVYDYDMNINFINNNNVYNNPNNRMYKTIMNNPVNTYRMLPSI